MQVLAGFRKPHIFGRLQVMRDRQVPGQKEKIMRIPDSRSTL